MAGLVRRINLLTVLALLLSGLLQPLAAARGVTCVRADSTEETRQMSPHSVDIPADPLGHTPVVSSSHQHDPTPQPHSGVVPAAGCAVAAIPAEQKLYSPPIATQRLLQAGNGPPASLLIRSHFRPPRLS